MDEFRPAAPDSERHKQHDLNGAAPPTPRAGTGSDTQSAGTADARINVGVVGLGKMGLSHLAMINSLDDFRVVSICDSAAMVGGVIEKYSGLKYCADFDSLLATPGLQAVVIATPTSSHEAMVSAALQRGLHVFCEKPLTLSSAASRALSVLADARGLVNQVGYHNRFIGTFREVKKLLDAGALGRVSHVLGEAYGPVVLRPAKQTWRGKAGQGGGCLYDYAAHPLNLLNWYFGRPETVSGAVLKTGYSLEVDDEVYATFGFKGGATGQLIRQLVGRFGAQDDDAHLRLGRGRKDFRRSPGDPGLPHRQRGDPARLPPGLDGEIHHRTYAPGQLLSAWRGIFGAARGLRAQDS